MLESLRYLHWPNLSKAPAPGVVAAGVAVVGILGSILGLNVHFDWLFKKLSASVPRKADDEVKPKRRTSLFPESDGCVLPAESDVSANQGPRPCATDSYLSMRPSSYDESTGVYVEWSFQGDMPVSGKDVVLNDYSTWMPPPNGGYYNNGLVEEFDSPYGAPAFNGATAPITLRRGPMRSSLSEHRGSVSHTPASYPRTPYAGGAPTKQAPVSANNQFTPFADSLASSPEMSPSFYAGEVSPVYDGHNHGVIYDNPSSDGRERMASFVAPATVGEPFVTEASTLVVEPFDSLNEFGQSQHSGDEWYENDVPNFGAVGFNPAILSVEEHDSEFAKSFLPTPELEAGDYEYTVSGGSFEVKTPVDGVHMEYQLSPTSYSPHLASPSTLSSRSSNGEEVFACHECDATFRVKGYLTRHLKKHAENKAYSCPFYDPESERPCHPNGGFSRRDTYKAHLKSRHFTYPKKTPCAQRSQVAGHCRECGSKFDSNEIWAELHVRPGLCPHLKTTPLPID